MAIFLPVVVGMADLSYYYSSATSLLLFFSYEFEIRIIPEVFVTVGHEEHALGVERLDGALIVGDEHDGALILGNGLQNLLTGSGVEVVYPEIRMTRYTKDFSWGFYCTNNYKQAYRWADRRSAAGVVNVYKYIENPELNILKFPEMSDEWLDFIAKCRSGEPHPYDIVEGPMADDTIWDFVNGFMTGKISRSVFWEYAKFKYPTHQISFHTINALRCLTFERSEKIHD